MNRYLLLLCLLMGRLLAQTDSLRPAIPSEQVLDQAIEDVILGNEAGEDVDFTFITDKLADLQAHPLDLNRASRTDLLQLPGMNELLVNKLRLHIETFGPLLSIYELQAVSGYGPELIRQIAPYVTVRSGRTTDIRPADAHPAGPGWAEVREGIRFELIQRFTWIGETQRGYTDPDTTFRPLTDAEGNPAGIDTALTTRYAGAPYRSYTRLRARYRQHVSLAVVGEKDPGEVWAWDPAGRQYGYDFLAGHVAVQDYGRLKRLVLGNYQVAVGQGLVLSRGLGFGKGAEAVGNVKMPEIGVMPYSSVNEAVAQRGVATTIALTTRIEATGFYSRQWVDASVQDRDTLTQEVLEASSLQLGGLHRTPTERSNRRALRETFYGGRLAYRSATFRAGITHYTQQFNAAVGARRNDYNQFDFRGDHNHVTGADFDWVVRNFNFFGEVARSRSGGMGGVLGLMASLAHNADVALVFRHFDRDFHSSKAYVFAERPVAAQNETGVYLGLKLIPAPRWQVNAYIDQYYFPWNKFRTAYPSAGWESLSQVAFRPRRGTEVYLRFRTDHSSRNARDYPLGQQLRYLVPIRRDQLRLHFSTQVNRDLSYRTRLEFSWFRQGEEARSRGMMLYQDLQYRLGYRLRFTGRLAVFDIPSFDARIYAFENDILGFFSIPPYNGTGTRAYLIVQASPRRDVDLWFRVARTRLLDVEAIGSGLEQVQGDRRTEFKVQMRWQF